MARGYLKIIDEAIGWILGSFGRSGSYTRSSFLRRRHVRSSSALAAYLVRAHVEPTLEVFGRMPLNFPVGGINAAAVEQFAQVQGGWGRIVEMPWMAPARPPDVAGRPQFATDDYMSKNRRWAFFMPPDSPKFVPVSKDGELLPEVKRVIGRWRRC